MLYFPKRTLERIQCVQQTTTTCYAMWTMCASVAGPQRSSDMREAATAAHTAIMRSALPGHDRGFGEGMSPSLSAWAGGRATRGPLDRHSSGLALNVGSVALRNSIWAATFFGAVPPSCGLHRPTSLGTRKGPTKRCPHP